MFKAIAQVANLSKTNLSRSLPSLSACNVRFASGDQAGRKEAPIIENETVFTVADPTAVGNIIVVPKKVDISPISGVPEEHVKTRRVRIYLPPKNAMQSGTANIQHWEMEFDTRQRWENPLMGWTSTGDPLSNMKIQFKSPEEAIEHCEKNGWIWYVDEPKIEKDYRPKNYGANYHWNRRTRVSTK